MATVTAATKPVLAQTPAANGAPRRGHVFVSNGAKLTRLVGARSVLHFGFGMEWLRARGLGLGFEAGPRFEDHDFTRFDDIMLSVDITYHPRSGSMTLDPFVDGGFSFGWEPVPDGQHTPFFSVGGGVTYWWKPKRGILFEVRDAVTLSKSQTGYHYLGARVGYAWRPGQS